MKYIFVLLKIREKKQKGYLCYIRVEEACYGYEWGRNWDRAKSWSIWSLRFLITEIKAFVLIFFVLYRSKKKEEMKQKCVCHLRSRLENCVIVYRLFQQNRWQRKIKQKNRAPLNVTPTKADGIVFKLLFVFVVANRSLSCSCLFMFNKR